jgi:hypothetical protein
MAEPEKPAMAEPEKPLTGENLWGAVKHIGKAVTFFPRLSAKIGTGEVKKEADLEGTLGAMAPKTITTGTITKKPFEK